MVGRRFVKMPMFAGIDIGFIGFLDLASVPLPYPLVLREQFKNSYRSPLDEGEGCCFLAKLPLALAGGCISLKSVK